MIDNAAKWASSRVHGCAKGIGGEVAILVEDDGFGLAEEMIPVALQPDNRLDENAPGHGFGLSITQELAELHGGGLDPHRSDLGGVKVTLTLPEAG